jgi:hypothetical protein
MPLIPKEDSTNEETVAEKKLALERADATETKLRSRLEVTGQRVSALAIECGDTSSAVYIGEAEDASEERLAELRSVAAAKLVELDATKAEQQALTHAVSVAASQTGEARMALVRVQHRNHVNRISKLLERLLGEVVRLENHIDECAGSWRKICEHVATLRSSWPGDASTLNLIDVGVLWDLTELQLYKSSAVCSDPHLGFFVEAKGASRFPGAKCNDPLLQNPEKIRPMSDQVEEIRQHLLDVLQGRKDGRTGALTAAGIEAASVTQVGAELKQGRLASEQAPIHQPTLAEKLAAVSGGIRPGAILKDGEVIADVTPAS